jgi:hypothetical protein
MQRRLRGDALAVDDDPVAALKILDRDAIPRDDQQRVTAGDERIVERELAAGAATDGELPLVELEVVMEVPQAEAHGRFRLRLPARSLDDCPSWP